MKKEQYQKRRHFAIPFLYNIIGFVLLRFQHRMPVPIAINVPNVPPPCSITLPTLLINSRPRNPYLYIQKKHIRNIYFKLSCGNFFYRSALNPPNKAPLAIPTHNPIVNPIFIRSKQLGPCC